MKEIGVSEIPGPENNKRIISYHKETSLLASEDEVPWCSSFVNWCFKQAGITGTRRANARSWSTWGSEIKYPVFGCVVVMTRGDSPSMGHVGFFVGLDAKKIKILGGNQGDKVSVSSFDRSRVLGYRLP